MKQIRGLLTILASFAVLFLCSCESQVATGGAGATARFAQAPTDRPGLGTKWGETRPSRVGLASFRRADSGHPLATAAIYYNDAAGIRAMAGAVAWQRRWSPLPAPTESLISVGLKGQSGRFLPGVIVGDRWLLSVRRAVVTQSSSATELICALKLFCRSTASMSSTGAKHRFANPVT